MKKIVFFDTEINPATGEVLDIGAVDSDGKQFHSQKVYAFEDYISEYTYIGGHNIIECDLKYMQSYIKQGDRVKYIDTLYLSPLLFPLRPYHRLLKDDKLQTDSLSNPYNDAVKAMELFWDEVEAFHKLDDSLKEIYYVLLHDQPGFSGFFQYVGFQMNLNEIDLNSYIHICFQGNICSNKDLKFMILNHSVELAYCLAVISVDDRFSVTPSWVRIKYPIVDNYMRVLRNQPCAEGCEYCNRRLDIHAKLKEIFNYDAFRTYNDEPLQEMATDAAVHNQSLLAIFPTGGGKSITFQLPALMASENTGGLTVVISPLQSLMKDQVDNLTKMGIFDAVTVNGMLSAVERSDALNRVKNGLASILYISPESLRSKTIENVLLSRNIVRFVIDEAHCFSAWGQDFRVDYLYIGDFIRRLQDKKNNRYQIPVSCFTATAKQKVISDIQEYFKQKLGLNLELFATSAARKNLQYKVLYMNNDEEKYTTLRDLIEQKNCPTIVYVSRTKSTYIISKKLSDDGYSALPFNGQMDNNEKVENQEAFISGQTQIIVATSAFGMGVDKKDVCLVVHYDISDSLENYVQEAGRAGRDPSLEAECYVLFNENDLDKHFILLNQTKLSLSEIQQVWRAIKNMTKTRSFISRSPLEIARQAGWDENVMDVETRVKTAVATLESAGYIRREQNSPRVYATSILVRDMVEASNQINTSVHYTMEQKENALRIIKLLISSRSRSKAGTNEAESRVDYIADMLGLGREVVIETVQCMREDGLLADTQDMSAYIKRTDTTNKSMIILNRYLSLEKLMISLLTGDRQIMNLKELNVIAEEQGIKGISVSVIKNLLYFWTIKGYIEKNYNTSEKAVILSPKYSPEELMNKCTEREQLAQFIIQYLYQESQMNPVNQREETLVLFSVKELQDEYEQSRQLYEHKKTDSDEVEDALLYLSKIGSLSLEGGFLVLYNAMEIRRLEMDNRIQYKNDDYKQLNEFYKQKMQQIHIVGEYANMMVEKYEDALQFVSDYFNMDYKGFLAKYFKGNRLGEINRNITPSKYNQLFNVLSDAQREIIDDDESQYIVVAAGPGSGKTRVLVHKLAALVLLDDVKYEQLLMLTFSRAAATEFQHRMIELIGGAARFLEIKTFHSYCFDILGKIGSIEQSDNIVQKAVDMIRNDEVEIGRITKTIVVIDEAQDMDAHEFSLIQAMMECNENMRILAVGDDDQNIYEFRHSDSKYLRSLVEEYGAKKYELVDNYRSNRDIVDLANRFAQTISTRLKTNPIQSVREGSGVVQFIDHRSSHLEYPVVKQLLSNYKPDQSAAILTTTNDEAFRIMGLLKKQKIPATLIQSDDNFSLYNLLEMRAFVKMVMNEGETPVITDDEWNHAIKELRRIYARSDCLKFCCDFLEEFAEVNNKKYKSDLENYLRESKASDLYARNSERIVVSTIHKAKGREYDCVYMLLNNVRMNNDEERRKLYVGMTRAKSELYIHYTNGLLNSYASHLTHDTNSYPEADEIILELSLRDIVLDYAKDKSKDIQTLCSGDSLSYQNAFFQAIIHGSNIPICKLSKRAKEHITLLLNKGYQVVDARVRYIVGWWDEKDEKEYPRVLAEVTLKKDAR